MRTDLVASVMRQDKTMGKLFYFLGFFNRVDTAVLAHHVLMHGHGLPWAELAEDEAEGRGRRAPVPGQVGSRQDE